MRLVFRFDGLEALPIPAFGAANLMSRVLVTGAQGFTARHLVPRLLEQGDEVSGLFRPGGELDCLPDEVEVHVADLVDQPAVQAVVERVRPETVIHLAGISYVAHSNVREIYDANLIGSRVLLQALADTAQRPSAVLLASSANVYGNQRGGKLNENSSLQPVNDYGISKLAMEHVAELFRDTLRMIVVRPFNYTGVGQSPEFLIPKIVDHAKRQASTIRLGNLDVERDFSDVRGVVDCYLRLLACPKAVGQTFNVCSGRAYTLRSILERVESLVGYSMLVETDETLIRDNEVRTLFGDNERLLDVIGPLGMPPLEATLQWMIEA